MKTASKATPVVTIGIVLLSLVVFLYELSLSEAQLTAFFYNFALIPCEYTGQCALDAGTPNPLWITLFSSMFMHGGWDHLLGNMAFLLAFGIHVERAMGAGRYLAFYLLCGLGASALSIVTAADSSVPQIGASGAISGVLAGYLVLFPGSHIDSIVPVGIFAWGARIPAWLFIGGWFAYQLIAGLSTYGDAGVGVAYGAHIGGFLTGLVLVGPFTGPDDVSGLLSRRGRSATI